MHTTPDFYTDWNTSYLIKEGMCASMPLSFLSTDMAGRLRLDRAHPGISQ